MNAATISSIDAGFWTEEPASRPDRVRIRARIAGMHCSLCTGTIEKALGRHEGVEKVAVSLTHEQALVEYDPRRVQPRELLKTLREMGYTISDPRKLQPFDEQERQLVQEGRRFLVATVFSLGSLTLIARPGDFWYAVLEAFVALCLLGLVFLVLRSSGKAVAGTSAALARAEGPDRALQRPPRQSGLPDHRDAGQGPLTESTSFAQDGSAVRAAVHPLGPVPRMKEPSRTI